MRNEADQSAPLGIATTRYEDRMASALLGTGNAAIEFDENEGCVEPVYYFYCPHYLRRVY